MIFGRIDGINTNGIGAQFLEKWNISLTLGGIGERVNIVVAVGGGSSAAISQELLLLRMSDSDMYGGGRGFGSP